MWTICESSAEKGFGYDGIEYEADTRKIYYRHLHQFNEFAQDFLTILVPTRPVNMITPNFVPYTMTCAGCGDYVEGTLDARGLDFKGLPDVDDAILYENEWFEDGKDVYCPACASKRGWKY